MSIDTTQSDRFTIVPELPIHAEQVEKITLEIFGPGMFARAAFVLREGIFPEPKLSFVALDGERVVGSVRQTLITIGVRPALLLGPLGVLADLKNAGLGRALMKASMRAARDHQQAELVLLVGDLSYYKKFGFCRVDAEKIEMPRPVDTGRILACELRKGALVDTSGKATGWR